MKKPKQWMHSEGKTILWSLKQTCTIKKLPLFLWLALFLAISLSPTLSLLFSQRMIDNITAAIRDPSVKLQIGNIIIWGLFLTLSAGLSNLCALVFSTYLSNTYSIYMQERLMEQFNRIPLRQFANADFMNKTAGAVAGADRLSYFVDKSVALMTTVINIVFSYVVLVRTNIGIAGIALVIGIFVCSLSFRDVNDTYNTNNENRKKSRMVEYYQSLPRDRSAAAEMRLNNLAPYWKQKYTTLREELKASKRKSILRSIRRSNISKILVTVCTYAIILIYIMNVRDSGMTVGMYVMITGIVSNVMLSLPGISNSIKELGTEVKLLTDYREFCEICLSDLKLPSAEKKENPAPVENAPVFELKNVSFSYDGSTDVLKNINLSIFDGEKVALIGKNGCGKSTLINLILGLYQPTEGEIFYKGHPYSEYDRDFITKYVGITFQDYCIFEKMIDQNIGMGDVSNIGNEELIREAAEKGQAEKFIEKLPYGMKTWIGKNYDFENGVDLSGGERQRLAISRAYMNNKRVMIMDEPTAALDPIAEMKQYQSISSMMAENTAILVSHRIGFARLASRIIVMDDGRVAEQGTHEELIAVNGGYKALFDAQSEWYQ